MTVEELEQKLRELSEQNLEANNLIVHYIAEIEDLEFELGQSNRMIDEQQAEIKRLKQDQAFDAMLLYSSGLACEQVKAENDELKKQVDKLTEELQQSYKELEKFEDMRNKAIEVCDNCHKKYTQKIEQVIEDTAKKCWELKKQQYLKGYDWVKNEFEKQFGIEVE